LIGHRIDRESCDKKGKKVSEAIIQKAENDNLTQVFIPFPLFGTWPQVLKRILLVSIELMNQLNI
jgi:hypothetical protein